MDYNTQREKLKMPEYGRHIQKMIEKVKGIEDKEKRNEQIQAVVDVMGSLNPSMKDNADFRHKLWDHVYLISGFDLDVDSPFPVPTQESFEHKPEIVPVQKKPIKAAHYGRNIQNMIDIVAAKEDGEIKDAMIKSLAIYMRQQYLIWNKDSVSQETIFEDMRKLSDGRLVVPDYIQLEAVSSKEVFNRPGIMNVDIQQNGRQNTAHRAKNSNNNNNNNSKNKNFQNSGNNKKWSGNNKKKF